MSDKLKKIIVLLGALLIVWGMMAWQTERSVREGADMIIKNHQTLQVRLMKQLRTSEAKYQEVQGLYQDLKLQLANLQEENNALKADLLKEKQLKAAISRKIIESEAAPQDIPVPALEIQK